MTTHIVTTPIDLKPLQGPIDPSCGAQATFVGTVRNHNQGHRVTALFYECHTEMANKEISRILSDIKKQYGITRIEAVHRVGHLNVNDIAVAIVVDSSHRQEAFAACEATINAIKRRVPIWKKEIYDSGESAWVICNHTSENTPPHNASAD